jgi:kanamycin nucleotidyltransferase
MSSQKTPTWIDGPVPKNHTDRLSLATDIAERARRRFNAAAVAAYGSLARGDDGPYSDIELICVADAVDDTIEWLHDGWRIEVDVRSPDSLLHHASSVASDWSITHANYVYTLPIHDPDRFFGRLATVVKNAPQTAFDRAIANLCGGELHQAIAKLRNARSRGEPPPPGFVFYVAKIGYWLLGLANRHPYATASRALAESLSLAERLPGYDPLCRMALAGDITDSNAVFEACEAFWRGAAECAAARGMALDSSAHLI